MTRAARPSLEALEDRSLPSPLAPVTPWHYANGGNFAHGAYSAPGDPGSAGFNLVDIDSPAALAHVPAGCQALVVIDGVPGVTAEFIQTITPYLGNPKVFGFYLADEPNPALVSASNLKAESDWIHANDPGAKTFIVLGAGPFLPFAPAYTPATTDVDLVGLDPYPTRTWGYDPRVLPLALFTAEFCDGWSPDQIVPVYQAFGATGTFAVPTVLETEIDLAIWGLLVPHPAFDYTYSWGEAWGSQALVDLPALQAVFQSHNAGTPPGAAG